VLPNRLLINFDYSNRMKLITFENAARQSRVGAMICGDNRSPSPKTADNSCDVRIVDLHAACALYLRDIENEPIFDRLAGALIPADMRGLFEGGDTSLEAARKAIDYAIHIDRQGEKPIGPRGEIVIYAQSDVQLKAPIVPKKFFHTAGNFREHHEEATKAGFSHPVMPWIVFFQNTDAIIGPNAPVIYPEHLTRELDYELELAVVLKKSGKNFSPEEAGSYIGGYLIFNDITARDIQRREMKSGVFSFCKGIDTFCPLGPWIVTADQIANPHNLAMELRVNGEPRQRSHSSKMSVTIPEILSHYSPMGYSAGDVVSTGTVSGVAAFSGDPKAWYLKPGDVMECEIEDIGVLRNPVISWEEAYGQKPATLATQETE
jgi:2-keto-4-pentenoate hydratase/2-oxohepta-3-ene-1,7-dioic acid hydratase in catechol pathway